MTRKVASDSVVYLRAGLATLAGLILATGVNCAHATELVGRVVDTMGEKVFESASVQVNQRRDSVSTALTDRGGFFRIEGLSSGSYSVNITLSDGRSFAGRAVVNGARRTQFVEFDYSRLVPPSDEDDY
ncbi:MAG: carboxypeptidase regulatory-like domain-containing protein [Alcaligenaceae bacterium]|nr:carboxypeptidase regulatory-like domain-containing protein [Alcaligenaceae bacterium]